MDLDPLFIRSGLIIYILLLASIVAHGWGHAIVATLLGDDTARAEGGLSLNPVSHFDWVGTVFVPAINIFVLGGGVFSFIGWGRPVMTNPARFRHRWLGEILVTFAGPAANLLVALVSILAGAFVVTGLPRFGGLVKELVVMNVGLAVFNLLPIPPLDGGSLMRRVLGISDESYLQLSRWGVLPLVLAISLNVPRNLLGHAVAESCVPYAMLCAWINPTAFSLIFRT